MRQAVELIQQETLDVIAEVVGVLLHNSTDEAQILTRIAGSLVRLLDYSGVAIVTGDHDDLYLRACELQPGSPLAASMRPVLQAAMSDETRYLRADSDPFGRSLVVRALAAARSQEGAHAIQQGTLYQLFYPLFEEDEAEHWQEEASIRCAAAIPFVLAGELHEQLHGCLLVFSSRTDLSEREQRLLPIVAQHLALGLRNARLYGRMEEQRRVAQTFAQMAFSSSAYLHTLRNHIGGLRTYLGLVEMLPRMNARQRDEVVATSQKAMQSLDQVIEILDHLHEPWRPQRHMATDVNNCLETALLKVFRGLALSHPEGAHTTRRGLVVQWRLSSELPPVLASPDMLTEAFRIVIRNAADSLHEKYGPETMQGAYLTIESAVDDNGDVLATVQDNGMGIAADDLRRIFELGWSTKKGRGMGFGLFWTRNFVEGLGGAIEADSVPQQGATFRFRLQASDKPAD